MKITISKSIPLGKVTIPSSKSITIRALFCASLSRGESQIHNPLISDDTNYAVDVLSKVGVSIKEIDGVWHINGGHFRIPPEELNCGESATTLRMMTALVSLLPGTIKLTGGPSLTQRPIRALVDALKMLGVKGATATPLNPPVTIHGGTFKGGTAEIAGNVSSQYISALLLIGSFAPVETIIKLNTPLTSRPYILLTTQVLSKFGISVKHEGNSFRVPRQRYEPCNITIEGDWSSASYFLALGALSEQGVLVENIGTSSRQGDRVILDHLRAMGADVRVVGSAVAVKKSDEPLKPINVDLTDCIDLFPTIAVLASLANGESEIRGIQRARIKESNRVTAMREGLAKLGVQFSEFKEYVTIKGLNTEKKNDDDDTGTKENLLEQAEDFFAEKKEPPTIVIDSHNDHRIAMAFAVMGAALGGVTITNAECVKKTFPEFWKLFKNIGCEFKAYE
jgi:3-phosphoshikimate 1-carboxyvinyltransferase